MVNRAPLAANAFGVLPIGAISARGWLQKQLELSARGLTGRMMDVWEDVGPRSAWLGGDGESWERGPYYARGLIALAYTLGDDHLIRQAKPWVEWSLASQGEDGFFGPRQNEDWWARMPMLEALRWYHDATGDGRVTAFLPRYFRHQRAQLPSRPLELWGKPRGGDNLDSVLWLYNRTGEPFLLELADVLHSQTSDWLGELGGDGAPDETFDHGHGVNRAMGFKEPAVFYQRSGDPAHLAVLRRGWERMRRFHGQIQGMYSGDEFLHGVGSTQGTELCTVVELLSSFETALRIGGEAWIADAIERIAYNALPAMLTADHCGHQYFQQPNQVECSPGGRAFSVHHDNDLLFGPATGYGCCAANFHMGWPRFVQHLWMAAPDGGLAAMIFGPSVVRARVRGGAEVTIEEDTDYPFGDEIRFTVRAQAPVVFPLTLRIPEWADGVSVSLNGRDMPRTKGRAGGSPASGSDRPRSARPSRQAAGAPLRMGAENWLCIESREWRDGDVIILRLPMRVRVSHWERSSVGVERGPLVYALAMGEDWRKVAGTEPFCDYEVHPTTPWNYALVIDPDDPGSSVRERRRAMAEQPWAADGSPVVLGAPARRVPSWKMVGGSSGPIPTPPVAAGGPTEEVELIPYGCARLRISMFPLA